MQQPKKWIDARGREVPSCYVPAYDKAKDRVVRKIEANARKLREQMEAFLASSVASLNSLAGLKESLGERGNFSARSFDSLVQISIRQSWQIRLDERSAKARELMLDYASRELGKAGDGAYLLRQMIEAAFRVDRYGYLPKTEVTKLLSYNVKDAKWQQGVDILKSCQSVERGKRYLLVETRKSTLDDFAVMRLDLADCWPREDAAREGGAQ